MSFDIISHIRDMQQELTRSEMQVAQLVLENTQFIIEKNINEISTKAKVSMPTVTRFCRAIGISGLRELKLKLSQNTTLDSRFLNSDQPVYKIGDISENILIKAQQALFQVGKQINIEAISQAIELILSAKQIYAFGSGGISSMLATETVNRFFRLQINILHSNDYEMQKMMAATLKKNSLVILYSVSGHNQNIIKCAQIAKLYGAKILTISRSNTPLAQSADVKLELDIQEGEYVLRPTSSRYAYMALLDILANGTAAKLDDTALETLRRLRQNQSEAQIINDSPLGD